MRIIDSKVGGLLLECIYVPHEAFVVESLRGATSDTKLSLAHCGADGLLFGPGLGRVNIFSYNTSSFQRIFNLSSKQRPDDDGDVMLSGAPKFVH